MIRIADALFRAPRRTSDENIRDFDHFNAEEKFWALFNLLFELEHEMPSTADVEYDLDQVREDCDNLRSEIENLRTRIAALEEKA